MPSSLRRPTLAHTRLGALALLLTQCGRFGFETTSGTLFVQGTIQTTGASANGVLGRLLVGDTEVWQQFVGPGPTSPLAFQTLVSVQVGDAVNFLLEPFESNDSNDATDFVVQLCR